ncbi:serine hydrolase domain-containing protein [Phenylobacterium sp. VNQ135]|uniref:serine hydrolase domain-containing protein n=1 Tax=Phenylobacterium sp. VNQ135 TaxID=3400922 RepID=UPI003C11DDCF
MRRTGFAMALAVALIAAPATAAAEQFGAVTRYLEDGYRSLGLPGASLLVVKDGKTAYERHFGAYTAETVVPIASASKWLSAAVVMTLVDEGRLDLDAPISTYLPQFTGKKGEMTIRQMFAHTSGLIEPPSDGTRWNYDITMAEYADRMARDGVMAGDPGTGVRYASASMQAVGAVAEKVTGKSWNELFRERIGIPCDMPDTTYVRTPGTAPPATMNEPTRNPMVAAGARSSMRDYGHFLEMIANGGVYKGRRVISERSVREMQKDQTGHLPLLRASNDRLGRESHYGLGQWIDVQAPDGRTIQVSSPGAWGFRPWLNLDRGVYGVFVMQRKVGGPVVSATFDPWKLIDLVHEAAADAR